MARQLTQLYLNPSQKTALRRRAVARGTTVAQEVRQAVDAYLHGIVPDDLKLLDEATRQAEADLRAMAAVLDRGAMRARKFFVAIERIKAGTPA